jgi:hypothetical protein
MDLVLELNGEKLPVNDVDIFIRAAAPQVRQTECVKNRGLWNYEDSTCYKYFVKFFKNYNP